MPKKNNGSSQRWLKEHFTDPYVKLAQSEGYRSRAVYKLLEIQKRDQLFKSGMVVVELGAAPGGWSQVLSQLVGQQGKVIALDLLPMEALNGVSFIQGDFTDDTVLDALLAEIGSGSVNWVVSDMAPNMSGNASIDVPRSVYLAELALEFALKVLDPNGGLLMKVLQGEGFDTLLKTIKAHFKVIHLRKPKASRGRSREIYVLARELRSNRN